SYAWSSWRPSWRPSFWQAFVTPCKEVTGTRTFPRWYVECTSVVPAAKQSTPDLVRGPQTAHKSHVLLSTMGSVGMEDRPALASRRRNADARSRAIGVA